MKRLLVGTIACVLIGAAVVVSTQQPLTTGLQVRTDERNPWNHLRLNNDPAEFRFAIVSDRTGGHREKIFSGAVEQLNLMQPEFVVSVGDLIEGGTEDPARLKREWEQFQGFVNRLQMPFFYVPGNHDISNVVMEKWWKDLLGRPYYHYVYRNVLFLMLNSNDPPKSRRISADQLSYIKSALEANRSVRWTLLFLHHPLWAGDAETSGWLEVEKLLTDRPYTVFCGHIHRYQRYLRNGRHYYQLATTGGGSKVRGAAYGEFDHIVWVTMKKDGPLLANLLLDGILAENLQRPETTEAGTVVARLPTFPVQGRIMFDGKPVAGAVVTLHSEVRGTRGRPDGWTDQNGNFAVSTYRANDGAPAGDYIVTVVWRKRNDDGTLGPNQLPESYSDEKTTPLRLAVREGSNQFEMELKR